MLNTRLRYNKLGNSLYSNKFLIDTDVCFVLINTVYKICSVVNVNNNEEFIQFDYTSLPNAKRKVRKLLVKLGLRYKDEIRIKE
jgi:hypothetical protein